MNRIAQPLAATVTHTTSIGDLTLAATSQGVVTISGAPSTTVKARLAARNVQDTDSPAAQAWLDRTRTELDQYFAGTRRSFTVPTDMRLAGQFDRTTLAALNNIPYGTTASYGQLAALLGLPREDIRKVGQAMARNPVLIIVPCHRIVGADGTLTGYAGGLPAKRHLLDLENDQQSLLNPNLIS
jgi:methylated-DNA-[protein]-cysteine S-methyltransferase